MNLNEHRLLPRTSPTSVRRALLAAALFAITLIPAAAAEPVLGRWALTIPGGGPGWLELRQEKGWYDGSILWGGGSVLPLSSVVDADGAATLTRTRDVTRKDAAGRVIRTEQLTETITARADGDTLKLVQVATWFKPGEWNDMTVSARGGHLTVTVNGKVSADLPNDPGRTKGRIALQLHGAKDCDVWFKDIAIQTH